MKCKKKKMSEEWQGPSRRVPFSVMPTIQSQRKAGTNFRYPFKCAVRHRESKKKRWEPILGFLFRDSVKSLE